MTKGKIDKKISGNNSYLVSFELFLVLCQQKWTIGKKGDTRHEVRRGEPVRPATRRQDMEGRGSVKRIRTEEVEAI